MPTIPGIPEMPNIPGIPAFRGAFLGYSDAQAFTWLWGEHSDVWPDFMEDQGEANLQISRWQMLTPSRGKSLATSDAPAVGRLGSLFPGENFEAQRELTFTHTRNGLVVGESARISLKLSTPREVEAEKLPWSHRMSMA